MKNIKKYSDFILERKFTTEQRETLADKGFALPDGSFPIETQKDLKNAIKSYGLSKDKSKAKKHIIKRAKDLNLTNLLPESW